MERIYYSYMDSPIGELRLARSNKGLCRLDFNSGEKNMDQLLNWAKKQYDSPVLLEDRRAFSEEKWELEQYFQGRRKQFTIPLDLVGTLFQRQVWHTLQTIPYGQVWSYKQVAQAIGSPKAVRAVGGANNKNPISIIVPCHRVIGANGSLVGYGGGLPIKEKLLFQEGFKLEGGQLKEG